MLTYWLKSVNFSRSSGRYGSYASLIGSNHRRLRGVDGLSSLATDLSLSEICFYVVNYQDFTPRTVLDHLASGTFSHLLEVLLTTAASLLGHLGHRRHGRVLNSCRRRSRRNFRRARLLWLNAEKSVEESDAEFPAASEIHENVDGVV